MLLLNATFENVLRLLLSCGLLKQHPIELLTAKINFANLDLTTHK